METGEDLEIQKDLVSGTFSNVKRAKHKDTEKLIALIIIKDEILQNGSILENF